MAKKITTVALICLLLVSMLVVPSMALYNPYLVQGEGTAMFFIPAYGLYAIKRDYLPTDFYEFASVNTPLILFTHFDTVEVYPQDQDALYVVSDDAFDAPDGFAYGLAIFECMESTLNDGTIVVEIDLCIARYKLIDGTWVFDDVEFEPDLVDESQTFALLYFFANNIISNPNNVSDFFAFMYPMLPLIWTDYSKIVNGTYQSGYSDGEREGRRAINLKEVNAAYQRGKADGFDEGYNEGFYDAGGKNYFEELVDAVIFAPVNGIVEMMNFDFFGINVANFFLALLTILILAGILALIARFIL